jgi:hypothetical protein
MAVTEIIDGVPVTKTPIVPTTAAVPVMIKTYGFIIVLLTISMIGFMKNETVWNFIPLGIVAIGMILVTIYFFMTLINIPENTGIILLDQSTGLKVPIGGPGYEGLQLKPKLLAYPESEKDAISLQRRWIKDKSEIVTSSDRQSFKIIYSGSYAWDHDRLIEVRGIEAVGADGAAEGAFSSLIRSEAAKLTAKKLQDKGDKLQEAINNFNEVNPHIPPNPRQAKTSVVVQRLRKKWPVCAIQLDIEEIKINADTRAAQEAVKRVDYTAEVALKAMFPKLPDKKTLAYKTLEMEAKKAWIDAAENKIVRPKTPDDATLLAQAKADWKEWAKENPPVPPEVAKPMPSDIELLVQAKEKWKMDLPSHIPFPTGEDWEVVLQAHMWAKLKSGEDTKAGGGMSYTRAFEHAMNLAAQTTGINISGSGAGATIIPTKSGAGGSKKK